MAAAEQLDAAEKKSRGIARDKDIARRLRTTLIVPLVLLVAVGGVLSVQIERMSKDAYWLDHTADVLGKVTELQKQIIDQETGLRGFLLTNDRLFLEPYERARPLDLLTDLARLVADNPEEVDRVADVRGLYENWSVEAKRIATGDNVEDLRATVRLLHRKQQMDDIRQVIAAILNAENALRRSRSERASSSLFLTRILFVGLLGVAALVLGFLTRRQLSSVAGTFSEALASAEVARIEVAEEAWIRAGQVALAETIQGELSLSDAAAHALRSIATYAGADVGALFTADAHGWQRLAGHAIDSRAAGPESFARGEGLVGRAALSKTPLHVRDVPADFLLLVRSGTGQRRPGEIVLVPAYVDNQPYAVIELAFLAPVPSRSLALLERVGENIALAIRSAEHKLRLRELLEESQRQSEELQTQQEELRVANEELEEQSKALRDAGGVMEQRQEELETINAQLEEQTQSLRIAQQTVTDKAIEVERASRYKSEFLANMSHELRTPLNSSLILAKLLADNSDGNLTAEQVRFAENIYSAGTDLLTLINDVLDLSKIESGKVELSVEPVPLAGIEAGLRRVFEPLAAQKGVTFAIRRDGGPIVLETDRQRLDQVLRNLLSNAFKFTEKGSVTLTIGNIESDVCFVVEDTGIGIPEEQQSVIFEAFRQADGTTNRKYGGTGLGLSISRDLARVLGGDLNVTSTVGKGSRFTLRIPSTHQGSLAPVAPQSSTPVPIAVKSVPPPKAAPHIADDREQLDARRRLVLVIEDDLSFARIVVDLAHELEFQCVVAHTATDGVALAMQHLPSAVVLDMNLPDHSGMSVLDQLKHSATTRHIPVHVVSAHDYSGTARSMGAIGYLAKPATRNQLAEMFRKLEAQSARRVRRLLILDADESERQALSALLGGPQVEVVAVGTVKAAQEALHSSTFDGIVTDLSLPDASGFDLLEGLSDDDTFSFPVIIVYTGRLLTADEEQRLRKHSRSIIVKGERSRPRLLDEVTLFLHQVEATLPPERQRLLKQARDRESAFAGKQVLLAEDDVRNIFALSSVLEPKGMKLTVARNGREAVEALDRNPNIDLVLMDIMMPEVDGLEAIRQIRKQPRFVKLPIIALTAKVMKDDQENCLRAGASDYVPKPLDVAMLLSLMRVWMPK